MSNITSIGRRQGSKIRPIYLSFIENKNEVVKYRVLLVLELHLMFYDLTFKLQY